jgi:putative transposase
MAQLAELFAGRIQGRADADQASDEQELNERIGRPKLELVWLENKPPKSAEDNRQCIEPNYPRLSVSRQCDLVGLSRTSWYYALKSDTVYINRPFFWDEEAMRVFSSQQEANPAVHARTPTAAPHGRPDNLAG